MYGIVLGQSGEGRLARAKVLPPLPLPSYDSQALRIILKKELDRIKERSTLESAVRTEE